MIALLENANLILAVVSAVFGGIAGGVATFTTMRLTLRQVALDQAAMSSKVTHLEEKMQTRHEAYEVRFQGNESKLATIIESLEWLKPAIVRIENNLAEVVRAERRRD
jgi:Na+-translocating ferredoxin:NAD+ oxidoreductase RnfG subunit